MTALGGKGRVDECEEGGKQNGRQHPQHCAQRIFRQMTGIE